MFLDNVSFCREAVRALNAKGSGGVAAGWLGGKECSPSLGGELLGSPPSLGGELLGSHGVIAQLGLPALVSVPPGGMDDATLPKGMGPGGGAVGMGLKLSCSYLPPSLFRCACVYCLATWRWTDYWTEINIIIITQ